MYIVLYGPDGPEARSSEITLGDNWPGYGTTLTAGHPLTYTRTAPERGRESLQQRGGMDLTVMAAASFDHAAESRNALHAIIADPAHGAAALSSPQLFAGLLSDLLPDAPREAGLLINAVQKGLAGQLSDHVAHGLDLRTAINLTAASFADSTAFGPEACTWVTTELALALGLADEDTFTSPGTAYVASEIAQAPAGLRQDSARLRVSRSEPPAARIAPSRGNRASADTVAVRTKRRRRASIVVLGMAAVVIAGAAVYSLAGHPSRSSPPASRPPAKSSPASSVANAASPSTVIRDYYAAVNRHDWARLWALGGKNLGESYNALVAGYRRTRHVVVTRLTARGDVVSVRVRAYETTGAMQTYALKYIVTGGVIVAGQSRLLSTSG